MWIWHTMVAVVVLAVGAVILVDSSYSPPTPCEMVEFHSGDQSSPTSSTMQGKVCRETLDQWRAEQEVVK